MKTRKLQEGFICFGSYLVKCHLYRGVQTDINWYMSNEEFFERADSCNGGFADTKSITNQ